MIGLAGSREELFSEFVGIQQGCGDKRKFRVKVEQTFKDVVLVNPEQEGENKDRCS